MRELLSLCGYESSEMESELVRVRKAFSRLGVTDEDVERGKGRLRTYYDIDLKGVRKLLGLFVRELVRITLAPDEGRTKVIHGCMAPNFEVLASALSSSSKEICASVPNPPFMIVFGCILGKFVPILEAAENLWLRDGVVAHCAMVKTRLGLFALGFVPKPDLLITSGSMCDTSPKTNDLLHELYDIPTYCYDTCHDRELREYPDAARAIDLSAKTMRRLAVRMGEEAGVEITDDMVREILGIKRKFASGLKKIRELVQWSDPLPISPTVDNLIMWGSQLPLPADDLLASIGALETLYEELRERVEKGVGVVEKGAPRVLAVLPPHHTDPRLEHLINEVGIAIVGTDGEFSAGQGAQSAGGSGPEDPYIAMSQNLHSSMLYHVGGRIAIILDACKRLRVDGVLDRFHVGCRTVAGDAFVIKEAVSRELGLPALLLEWENFDPRVYNHEQFKTMLETFKTMMRPRG